MNTEQEYQAFLKEVGGRIGDWLDAHYPTRKEAAIAMNTNEPTISAIVSGARPFGPKMKKNFEAIGGNVTSVLTGISIEELERRKDQAYRVKEDAAHHPSDEESPFYSEIKNIPLIGKIAASPDGKEYFEDFPEGLSIPYRKGNYFSLLIENDSLINAPDGEHSFELYPNDVCIFELFKQPSNGDIIAVHLKNNKRLVKILKHKSNVDLELISANKFRNYPSVKIKKDEIATYGILVGKQKLTKSEMRKLGINQ
ncbi:MAG: S24 family peptidase [Bacteroidota bacterium]|nr:S24 family peptidase [Bacteroidota bacterium]